MSKIYNYFALLLIAIIGGIFTSCNKAEENFITEASASNDNVLTTRAATNIKNVVYIEVNDINPLNAGSYKYSDDNTYFYDYVILFAANIRGNCNSANLYFNPNVAAILADPDKYIRPLQAKGIKVLLGVLGDHTGVGFANLKSNMITNFATAIANALTTYGLDGVDFDDEYAKYGTLGCFPPLPSPSAANYLAMVNAVNGLIGDKLLTVYNIGYSNFSSYADVDYMWNPWYGSYGSTPAGLGNAKWAAQAIDMKSPGYNVESYATNSRTDGMGAILCYDLRNTDMSATMTQIARGATGNPNVSVYHDGNFYSKDY